MSQELVGRLDDGARFESWQGALIEAQEILNATTDRRIGDRAARIVDYLERNRKALAGVESAVTRIGPDAGVGEKQDDKMSAADARASAKLDAHVARINSAPAEVAGDGELIDRITEVLNLPDATGKGLALTGKGYMLLYRIRTDLAAALATRPAPGRDGWRMVPVEPTDAMVDAALKIQGDDAFAARAPAVLFALVKIYRAMIAAAPAPRPADPDFVRRSES